MVVELVEEMVELSVHWMAAQKDGTRVVAMVGKMDILKVGPWDDLLETR